MLSSRRVHVALLYKRTSNVVKTHAEKRDPKKMMPYKLNGFVWALKDSIPNIVLLPTSGELKADWLVHSQYYFNGEDVPFIQSVKPKCSDIQRCDSKDVPLAQETQDVLGNVASSYKGLIEQKIMDTVELLCKQLIDVRPEMNGMVDQLKVKVKKDVGVLRAAVVSCEMKLVDCPVVHEDISDLKNLTYRDTHHSTMKHLVNACAFVTNDIDDYMNIENDPSKYCLDNLTIGIKEDTQNGKLTVSLFEEQIANDNSYFDKLLKDENMNLDKLITDVTKSENKFDGNMNLDKLIADVTKSENKSASEVNVVKDDGKSILGKVFEVIGRIKKPRIFKQAPYTQKRPTTPQVKKKRKSPDVYEMLFKEWCWTKENVQVSLAPSELDGSQETLQPFKEVLRRHCKSNRNKVTVPTCMKCFLRNGVGPKQMYKFPWVTYGLVVDEHFCLALLGLDKNRRWWMLDDVAVTLTPLSVVTGISGQGTVY
nr:hypothetical protein [Tanacetum cinerariifolium]